MLRENPKSSQVRSEPGDEAGQLHRDGQPPIVEEARYRLPVDGADRGELVDRDGRVVDGGVLTAEMQQAPDGWVPPHAVYARDVLGRGEAPDLPDADVTGAGERQRGDTNQRRRDENDPEGPARHGRAG